MNDDALERMAKAIWQGIFNGFYAYDGLPTLTEEEYEPVWARLSKRERAMYDSAARAALRVGEVKVQALEAEMNAIIASRSECALKLNEEVLKVKRLEAERDHWIEK